MSDWYDYVPFLGVIGLCVIAIMNSNRIAENAYSITDLNYHNHINNGRSLPRDLDGELIPTLESDFNGIRGWY